MEDFLYYLEEDPLYNLVEYNLNYGSMTTAQAARASELCNMARELDDEIRLFVRDYTEDD